MVTYVLSFKFESFLSLTLLLVFPTIKFDLYAQDTLEFQYNDISVKTAIKDIIDRYDLPIIFLDSIPDQNITQSCFNCNPDKSISLILSSTPLKWKKLNSQYLIYFSLDYDVYTISGRAVDILTGEPIPYANVFISGTHLGDISNNDGIFSISQINTESCTLSVSYIGYETKSKTLSFPEDEGNFFLVSLSPKIISSKEVSIKGYLREFMDRSNNPGQVSFSPRHISTLPNLGEIDIFRSLQYLPGITFGLGGTSNLYIRGGLPEQNLIMLDGMPLYHDGHMFGFITAIASEAIKDVQVYKGGVPSRFGGGVSSVIELSGRSGNNTKLNGALYTNLMSQGLTLEVPLLSKGSVIINFRKSNPSGKYSRLYSSIQQYVTGDNKFSLLTQTADNNYNQSATYDIKSSYEDINSRLSFLLNPKHKMTLTQIHGKDAVIESRNYFGFSSILGNDSVYINENTNLDHIGGVINFYSKWNHWYNSNLSISSYEIRSNYIAEQFSLVNTNKDTLIGSIDEKNRFSDRRIKFFNQFNFWDNHKVLTGFEETYLSSFFNTINKDGSSSNNSQIMQSDFLHAFYLQDIWSLNRKTELSTGLRASYYDSRGRIFFEPRFSLKYKLQSLLSFEFSIDKHHQFIHKIASNRTDTRGTQYMWIFSSKYLPEISSTNSHLGLTFDNENHSHSLSIYSRRIDNLFQFNSSYKTTVTNENISNEISIGSGISNGFEVILRKKTGSITGWVAYHYNKVKNRFSEINNGDEFLADQNKSHEIKTIAITKLWNLNMSISWVFTSGGVFTDIDNMYVESGSGYDINITSDRNLRRLPSTHHMDVNISKSIQSSKINIDFGCSIYNIYNKNNISHKRYNPYTTSLSVTEVAMFGITPNAYVKLHF